MFRVPRTKAMERMVRVPRTKVIICKSNFMESYDKKMIKKLFNQFFIAILFKNYSAYFLC